LTVVVQAEILRLRRARRFVLGVASLRMTRISRPDVR
jgi:hypothetical protein